MVKMVQMVAPVPWGKSIADRAFLETLVAAGLLPPNTDPARPVWIAPGSETESMPPSGYVVSLAWLHKRGFCHLTGGGLRRHLRGLPGDTGALGSVEAPVPGWALH
jgi:hypothetical protein